MVDRRGHRGPHPADRESFSKAQVPRLRSALGDLCWLLDRGYGRESSLRLVGDRHRLTRRQRQAIGRAACSEDRARGRAAREWRAPLAGRGLAVDGFNVLLTVEAALGGAVVLRGRDGALRDLGGIHGSYHVVAETEPALRAIARALTALGAGPTTWWLDRPVSNSGRVATLVRRVGDELGRAWKVRLADHVDAALLEGDEIVATSDGELLDGLGSWLALARRVVEDPGFAPARGSPAGDGPWIIDLRPVTTPGGERPAGGGERASTSDRAPRIDVDPESEEEGAGE